MGEVGVGVHTSFAAEMAASFCATSAKLEGMMKVVGVKEGKARRSEAV